MNKLNDYEELKKNIRWICEQIGNIGFANRYLEKCVESNSDDEIDIQVYTKLVELDARLGVTAAEQLFSCVFYSLRLDLIKVSIQLLAITILL